MIRHTILGAVLPLNELQLFFSFFFTDETKGGHANIGHSHLFHRSCHSTGNFFLYSN